MIDRAWSYSALNAFETCAKRYYHLNVAKDVKEPPSEHLTHGNRVHGAFEKRVKSGTALPIGMRQHEPTMAYLASMPGEVVTEQKLAIDKNFAPCEYFASTVWVRVVLDYACINGEKAFIFDYKTGKRKEDDDQLALMAGVLMCHAPEIQEVTAAFFWMQEPAGRQVDAARFPRARLGDLFSRFLPRVERFQRAFRMTEFPANPGGLCRKWCPVKSCPHNGG